VVGTPVETRSRRVRSRSTAAVVTVLAALLVVGCGSYNPLEGSRSQRIEDRANALVLRYCAYGSASVPALEDCVRRVEVNDVRTDRSNAGRYASGEVAGCRRDDAGPYCGKIGP
jgi:hypothetical protein